MLYFVLFAVRSADLVRQTTINELQSRSWLSAGRQGSWWWAEPVVMWRCSRSSQKAESGTSRRRWWTWQRVEKELCGMDRRRCRWGVSWSGQGRVTSRCVW